MLKGTGWPQGLSTRGPRDQEKTNIYTYIYIYINVYPFCILGKGPYRETIFMVLEVYG